MIARHWLYCYASFVADLAESRIYHYVILNATLWKDFYIQLYSWLWSHFIVSIERAVVIVFVWYKCSWIYNYLCKIGVYHHLCCEFESPHGEAYSIQHYMIKFVSDLRQVGGYIRVLRFLPPKKRTASI